MAKFGVPRAYQQSALLVGIVLALIMRGIFIAVGAAAINNFSWVFYLFGLFLIYTAVKLAKEGAEDEDEYEQSGLITWVEKRFPACRTELKILLHPHTAGRSERAIPNFPKVGDKVGEFRLQAELGR
ncbi:MAG: TerC family protein, partial [Marmoricola sp.]